MKVRINHGAKARSEFATKKRNQSQETHRIPVHEERGELGKKSGGGGRGLPHIFRKWNRIQRLSKEGLKI